MKIVKAKQCWPHRIQLDMFALPLFKKEIFSCQVFETAQYHTSSLLNVIGNRIEKQKRGNFSQCGSQCCSVLLSRLTPPGVCGPPLESPLGCNLMQHYTLSTVPGTERRTTNVPFGYRDIHHKTEHVRLCTCLDGKVCKSPAELLIAHRFHVCFPEAAIFLFHLRIGLQSFEISWASHLCIIWLLVLKATSCYVWLLGGEMLSWASAIIYPQSSRSCHVLLTVSCSTLSASL